MDDFESPVEHLAVAIEFVGLQRTRVITDVGECRQHLVAQIQRRAGGRQHGVEPRRASRIGDALQVRCFIPVHRQACAAGQFQDPVGVAHVIRVHVREHDVADVRPRDAQFAQRGFERIEAVRRVIAGVDQDVPVVTAAQQIDVHLAKLERQRQFDLRKPRGDVEDAQGHAP